MGKIKDQDIDDIIIETQRKEQCLKLTLHSSQSSILIGKDGRTFGSVSTKEIAKAVKEQLGYDLDKKKMHCDVPINSLGTYNIEIKVHPKVVAKLAVHVSES